MVTEFIQQLEKKENTMATRIRRAAEYQLAVAKVRKKGKDALKKNEVAPFCRSDKLVVGTFGRMWI